MDHEEDPFGGLRLVRRRDNWGRPYTEVVADHPASLASVGFSVVAVMLGEVLRKALDAHMQEHECGLWSCPEAVRLFRLLPGGDQIAFG